MIKFSMMLLVFSVIASIAMAQPNPVPNPSFEQWTSNSLFGAYPTSWFGIVDQSTDFHTGIYAAHGLVTTAGNEISLFTATLDTQTFATHPGFSLPFLPSTFQGWYKLTSVQNDNLSFEVQVYSKGQVFGEIVYVDSTTTIGWKNFSVPIYYIGSETPDTAVIFVTLQNSQGSHTTHVGSSFIVDDISLSSASGIAETDHPGFILEQNFPNPFFEKTSVRYSLSTSEMVSLTVFNVLGEQVAVLENGIESAGPHEVRFERGDLPAGIYSYRLTTPDGQSTIRFLQIIK